ncbi:MAG TPA: cytochrome c, partial [Bryobacteraceae bacterium]|nr:cytochrome c [Bryobacteraceae bacterium]
MRFGKFCILALAAGSLSAQQPFTKGDVEFGGGLFRANCAVCHGPDGDFIPRADLGHGRFRRASSDQDLIAIINTGIEGTAMPGFAQVIETIEMGTVVSYLHYLASTSRSVSASGDPGRGRTLFEGRGSCLNCHRIRDKGSR